MWGCSTGSHAALCARSHPSQEETTVHIHLSNRSHMDGGDKRSDSHSDPSSHAHWIAISTCIPLRKNRPVMDMLITTLACLLCSGTRPRHAYSVRLSLEEAHYVAFFYSFRHSSACTIRVRQRLIRQHAHVFRNIPAEQRSVLVLRRISAAVDVPWAPP